jgi:hypothetical protein
LWAGAGLEPQGARRHKCGVYGNGKQRFRSCTNPSQASFDGAPPRRQPPSAFASLPDTPTAMSKAVVDLFVNREHIRAAFVDMLHARSDKQIMVLKAEGGMGKSWMLAVLRHECQQLAPPVPAVEVNFGHGEAHDYLTLIHKAGTAIGGGALRTLLEVLSAGPALRVNLQVAGAAAAPVTASFGDVVGGQVLVAGGSVFNQPTFHFSAEAELTRRERETYLTETFFSALREGLLARPAAFFFDTYEKAPQAARAWIETQLLPRIRDSQLPRALVVLAGREVPEMDLAWKHCTTRPKLEPLASADVQTFLRERLGLTDVDHETLYRATLGNPQLLGLLADNLTASADEDETW